MIIVEVHQFVYLRCRKCHLTRPPVISDHLASQRSEAVRWMAEHLHNEHHVSVDRMLIEAPLRFLRWVRVEYKLESLGHAEHSVPVEWPL